MKERNIILCEYMNYASDLPYDEAKSLLEKMVNSPASKDIMFSMTSEGQDSGRWKVQGMVRSLQKAFLKNPESYVISGG